MNLPVKKASCYHLHHCTDRRPADLGFLAAAGIRRSYRSKTRTAHHHHRRRRPHPGGRPLCHLGAGRWRRLPPAPQCRR